MDNRTKTILFALILVISGNSNAQSLNSKSVFSPSSSTLVSEASRLGHHNNGWLTYYIRYNDTSYFCSMLYPTIWSVAPCSIKIPLPQDLVITDFEKFHSYQGFIGSFRGKGMYGRTFYYNMTYAPNNIQVYGLPAVDCLSQIATIKSSGLFQTKAFAIGSKKMPSSYGSQSYILEFYAEGSGSSGQYCYAPLSYDTVSGRQERADDVAYKLVYSDGLLKSFDTIGCFYTSNIDMYMAIGDDKLFSQEISNGSEIQSSCLDISKVRMTLISPPGVIPNIDPIDRYSNNKDYSPINQQGNWLYGNKTCGDDVSKMPDEQY